MPATDTTWLPRTRSTVCLAAGVTPCVAAIACRVSPADPKARVAALERDIAATQTKRDELGELIHVGRGIHRQVYTERHGLALRARADALRPAVVAQDIAEAKWLAADARAETTAHAAELAARQYADATSGRGPSGKLGPDARVVVEVARYTQMLTARDADDHAQQTAVGRRSSGHPRPRRHQPRAARGRRPHRHAQRRRPRIRPRRIPRRRHLRRPRARGAAAQL